MSELLFVLDMQLHAADLLDGAVQMIAIAELADAGRRAGRDQVSRPQRQTVR